ncbi:MAG: RNA polymerase sigma factor [Candidatus Kapaibacterium sp.]
MHQQKQQRFLELLDREYERLERFALSMTRNREDAKELISETVAACYERFDSIEHDEAFLSYLFTVASRTFYKQKAKRSRITTVAPDEITELYCGGIQPDDAYDVQQLYNAIDALPEQYREIFIMAELLGFTHKEIQQTHGISIANIKVRIYRSKYLIRKYLGVDNPEPDSAHTTESAKPRTVWAL